MTEDLASQTLARYLEQLGSAEPTPGGGSAAAVAGALAASLGHMVISVAAAKESTPERAHLADSFLDLAHRFLGFASADESAFAAVMEALHLPKDDPRRSAQIQAALAVAADVPLRAAEAALWLLRSLRLAEPHASRSIVSDVGVAAHLALASLSASLLNVRVNQRALVDSVARGRLEQAAAELSRSAEAEHGDIVRRVAERLAPQ